MDESTSLAHLFQIQRFIATELPTRFPRLLTSKERAVIYRILSMLQSADIHQNYLVQGNMKDTFFMVWMMVHYPDLQLTNYSDNRQAYHVARKAFETLEPHAQSDILAFEQFVLDTFETGPRTFASFRGTKPLLELAHWTIKPARLWSGIPNPTVSDAAQLLEISIQEVHIAYFEYMLENCWKTAL